jgi:flagellar M-ring protein FliF
VEEFFTKVGEQFRNFFGELSLTRKVLLLVLLFGMILLGSMIVIWATKTRYDVLFTELNKEDATMVARMLEQKKIAYQFSEDGKTISVPEDQVSIWRLELAKQGLKFTGTIGYEIFDNQSFGTTTFVQKINKQRALEGELIKTINYIKGVKRARVHLSIPESSPFVAEKKTPTASVVIELLDGVVLTVAEIRGIALLVSSSVEGMRPENVVILDAGGKKLSENMNDSMTMDTANKLLLESKMSRNLEEQIQEILSKVVGEGKVIAKVAVNMDYTETVTTETKYDGENSAVLAEVSNTQKLVGSRMMSTSEW